MTFVNYKSTSINYKSTVSNEDVKKRLTLIKNIGIEILTSKLLQIREKHRL